MLKPFRIPLESATNPGRRKRADYKVVPPEDFVRMREWIRQAQADAARADLYSGRDDQNPFTKVMKGES